MKDKVSLGLMIVVLVLIVVLFVISFIRKKKYNAELSTMREELKIGDHVMIDTGVVGELVDSYEEDGHKYYVLKSGKGNNIGYFAVHSGAVAYVFGKEENVKVRADVEPATKTEKAEQTGVETETGVEAKPKKKSNKK